MTTGDLFDDQHPRRRARKSDPDTSHEAAQHVTKTGKASAMKRRILDFLRATTKPPMTAFEIADSMGVRERATVGRRTGEMEKDGTLRRLAKRRCAITGRSAATWEVK